MSLTAEFMQSVQALHQDAENSGDKLPSSNFPRYPTLEDVLAKLLPLPENGLFLGVASDNLPVLLNLKDPRPGPLLVLGDSQTGKTDFLQVVARAASLAYPPRSLRFAVVSPFPDEWAGWDGLPHCLGLWKPDDPRLKDFLVSLSSRVEEGKKAVSILLLVDDLYSLMDLEMNLLEDLRRLVENGPASQVWTIATLNAGQALSLPNWLGVFHTRLFGRIKSPELANSFTSLPGATLETLLSGAQFSIRERNHWLRFWIPLLK